MAIASLQFPVDEVVPRLLQSLESSKVVLLSAPPGAGKTTRIPPAIHRSGVLKGHKILMLEPRRLAARRAAEFMASQLGEEVGRTVGYRIRGDSRVSESTRVEVVTEGILTRFLQDQPDLPGVGMVIFDEFHERSIHADVGLAFTLDVQKHLRNDLRILIMSATLETARLSSTLGDIPVVESRGTLFPIETHFARFSSDKPIHERMAETIERSLHNSDGDVLAFLPGWREIERTDEILYKRHLPDDVVIHKLHGEASPDSQAAALAPAPQGKRKVILSTNVAETSITIDGVRIVVDSGLVRVARFDPRRGMAGLATIPVSRASADQRRGRAGRLGPGFCYRLWTEQEHRNLCEYDDPEIKSADLAPLALDLARWGSPNGENLLFIDAPPASNLQHAQRLLRDLDAIDDSGLLTPLGRSMAEVPVHPRLSHLILRAITVGLAGTACSVAALLEDRDLFAGGTDRDVDFQSRWHDLQTKKGAAQRRIQEQSRRLKHSLGIRDDAEDRSSLGLLVAFAYPDRIAQRKDADRGSYVTTSGKQAALPLSSRMSRHEFLAIAEADVVGKGVRIALCAPISKEEILKHFSDGRKNEDEIRWDTVSQSVVAKSVVKLGSVLLDERPIAHDDPRIAVAVVDGIRSIGLHALPWDKETALFRERSEWLRTFGGVGGNWPDLSDTRLLESLEIWLLPFLSGIRQRSQLVKVDLLNALKSIFSYPQLNDIDRFAPSHLKLPSGTLATIDYGSGRHPVLAIRLQELFGQVDTPRIGKGNTPVLIHLLSPAKRPLAVTQDLPSFWKNTYPEIRGQMRARYPKHVWPEDPLRATPTNKTKRHFERRK